MGTHQDGGSEYTLWRNVEQTTNDPAPTGQADSTADPEENHNPGSDPQRGTQQRPRNEPRSTMTQPRQK